MARSTRPSSTRRFGSHGPRTRRSCPPISCSSRSGIAEDSPLREEVAVALPLLEAVEHAALRGGVPVDARIEKGRSPTHALQRLWDEEHFDRIVAPAPNGRSGGFTAKDVTWILAHAPSETIVLKPSPSGALGVSGAD